MFGGEVVVAELAGLRVRLGEYGEQVAGGLRGRDGGAGDAGQGGEQPLGAGPHGGLVGVGGDQQVDDVLVVLACEEGQQQVRGGQVRMTVLDGPAGGRVQRVAALVGQFGVHCDFSSPRGVAPQQH